jgi:hypothetical protein
MKIVGYAWRINELKECTDVKVWYDGVCRLAMDKIRIQVVVPHDVVEVGMKIS